MSKNNDFDLINKENPNLNDGGKFEKAIDKIKHVPPYKASNYKGYLEKIEEEIPLYTGDLFEATIEKEINGVGMGVLNSGIPYLTQNGLAIMCGVESRSIRKITVDWKNEKITPRGKIIADILLKNGYSDNELYIPVKTDNQPMHYAYPESVCLAFLEYYAFHAVQTKDKKEIARQNLISLARKTFRDFIYASTGYNPETKNLTSWKHFHDRVSLNRDGVPMGYFSVFKEIAGMIVDLINAGLPINDKIIPDISVGITWDDYWKTIKHKYKERIKYMHNYPEEFRQSLSNPQEANAYPLEALGEFRIWFESEYLKNKYPSYIENKIKKMDLTHTLGNNIKTLFIGN